MTRANLNFIWQNSGEAPRTLFHYHNGDQYAAGLLLFFDIESFLSIRRPWTPDDFRSWIAKNYRVAGRRIARLGNGMTIDSHCETDEPAEPEDLGEGGQPRIYYTEGFITDYSYVFSVDGFRRGAAANRVLAFNWDRRVFSGTARRFLTYCRKKAHEEGKVPFPQHSEQAIKDRVMTALGGEATRTVA